MGLTVLVLLSFSDFKFLREKQRTRKKAAFIVATNIYWVFSMLPGTRSHFLTFFSTLKITINHVKETWRCLIADSNSGSRKAISSKVFAKAVVVQLRVAARNSTRSFPSWEPECQRLGPPRHWGRFAGRFTSHRGWLFLAARGAFGRAFGLVHTCAKETWEAGGAEGEPEP